MVRCKFTCTNKTAFEDGGARTNFVPVYTGSKENEEFFKYTPSGSIEIGTVNSEVAKQFEVGKEYYIDFIPAENQVKSPIDNKKERKEIPMNKLNINDLAEVQKTGSAAGCVGDGKTVQVNTIQFIDGLGLLYTGTYQNECGSSDSIQFAEGEYKVVNHTNN